MGAPGTPPLPKRCSKLLRGRGRPILTSPCVALALVVPTAAVTCEFGQRAVRDSYTRLGDWPADRPTPASFPVVAPFGLSIPAWMDSEPWAGPTRSLWSPWISYPHCRGDLWMTLIRAHPSWGRVARECERCPQKRQGHLVKDPPAGGCVLHSGS